MNKQRLKLHAQGLAFILAGSTVFWRLTGDHKMAASWASEAGSEAGRMIVDPSHTKVKDG